MYNISIDGKSLDASAVCERKAKRKDVACYIEPAVIVVIAAALLVSKWLVFDWLFIVIGILFLAKGGLGVWNELKK